MFRICVSLFIAAHLFTSEIFASQYIMNPSPKQIHEDIEDTLRHSRSKVASAAKEASGDTNCSWINKVPTMEKDYIAAALVFYDKQQELRKAIIPEGSYIK